VLDNAPFEKHYRIGELARMWGLGRETIRKLVKDEPGVVKVRLGRKKAHTIRCLNQQPKGYIRALSTPSKASVLCLPVATFCFGSS
jgi:hypothetical protein